MELTHSEILEIISDATSSSEFFKCLIWAPIAVKMLNNGSIADFLLIIYPFILMLLPLLLAEINKFLKKLIIPF